MGKISAAARNPKGPARRSPPILDIFTKKKQGR
jgi:hypothetical protein